MSEILKIRVTRDSICVFPFDLFYLVPATHKDLLPKLFPWSLCFTVSKELRQRIVRLRFHKQEVLWHGGRREDRKKSSTLLHEALPVAWDEAYFVSVPILPMTTRQVKSKHDDSDLKKEPQGKVPGYLTAPQHAQAAHSALEGILDDDTVLFTPQGPVRPICTMCPRHLLHTQNKCELGSKYCFSELILQRSYEQLQEDRAQSDTNSDKHTAGGPLHTG